MRPQKQTWCFGGDKIKPTTYSEMPTG